MKILVVRHGLAGDKAEFYKKSKLPDAERPLTPEGIRKFTRAARGIATISPKIDKILSSPLLRARQTAEILKHAAKMKKISETKALSPEVSPVEMLQELEKYRKESCVAIVGHEPQLSRFVSHCLGAKSATPVVELSKGSATLLDFPDVRRAYVGPAKLLWSLTQSQLRKIKSAE